MSPDLLKVAAGAIAIAVLLVIGKLALIPANRLGLGVFRPYRGDPWPVGVQEDDDARFSWTRRRPDTAQAAAMDEAAASDDPLDHVAFRPPLPAAADPETVGFEDVTSPDVDVQPLAADGVHHVRR